MKDSPSENPELSHIEQKAADWMLRIDRGLTPQEQDDYTEWLAQDPCHREAMALYQWGWEEFDRLAGLQATHYAQVNPDLLAPDVGLPPKKFAKFRFIPWFAALPIPVVLALTVFFLRPVAEPESPEFKPSIELMARIEQRALEDGSRVEINRGAKLEVAYPADRRLVYLEKGEANFEVAEDPNRPFIVNAAGVDIRAVGTIFNVKLSEDEVDVLVTRGMVRVAPTASPSNRAELPAGSLVERGQKATVHLRSETPQVEVITLSEPEIEEATLWQPRLLDFDAAPLGEIVDAFNRCNPIQVVIGDPSLNTVNLSSSFWSDNVEGFVRLMESSFGMETEWQGSREIVLRSAQ